MKHYISKCYIYVNINIIYANIYNKYHIKPIYEYINIQIFCASQSEFPYFKNPL